MFWLGIFCGFIPRYETLLRKGPVENLPILYPDPVVDLHLFHIFLASIVRIEIFPEAMHNLSLFEGTNIYILPYSNFESRKPFRIIDKNSGLEYVVIGELNPPCFSPAALSLSPIIL